MYIYYNNIYSIIYYYLRMFIWSIIHYYVIVMLHCIIFIFKIVTISSIYLFVCLASLDLGISFKYVAK